MGIKNVIAREYVEIPPDIVIFRDTRISLFCPMLVGLDKESGKVLVPFTKRCMGTFLVEIDAGEEVFSFSSTSRRTRISRTFICLGGYLPILN
jgi:hypothetical protein